MKENESQVLDMIGDVSGKGLSAALYMSKLQTMIRLYCADNKSPKEILTEVNKKLFGDMERNYFITVTLAMIDIEKGKIQLCRAGHPSTLLFDENGCERIKSSGIGLGLDKGDVFDASLEEVEREIKQGGLLAIYSDGISEAMNDKQDEFGEENIVRVLKENLYSRVDDIQNRLLSEVNSFCDGAEQHDDITLLLVKFS